MIATVSLVGGLLATPTLNALAIASKAFDRVNYCKLFNAPIKRDLPFVASRLLLNKYTCQANRVLWNGFYSNSFPVKNGVKQGGIVSPMLFCVYFGC